MKNKYFGQWSPPADQVIELNYFPDGTPPGVLVECGAGDGLTESCGKFFSLRGWRCINIEPDLDRYAALERNRPGEENLNIALSDEDLMSRRFHRGPHADGSVNSSCWTWSTLVERLGLSHVDLFVLDVEGHELAVIEGMRGCATLPEVVCAEYPWPTTGLRPLTDELAALGYHRHFLSFNNAFFGLAPRVGPFFGETREYKPGELG